ncbi:hypothetical protein Scep_027782 [Stephania cephalantha]|uniref:Uncharacterized protein n=1 Tax=Stephania cephalantha TaxID=152367 RepID=A0AAP0EAX5_9MAGN
MTWYRSVTRRFLGHDRALRDYSRNLVHRLRRVFIEDGYEQGLAALDEGIQILDEDERRRSTLSHDGIDVEQDINEDNEQDDEEDDQAEPNIEVRRRRARPRLCGNAPARSRPPRPSTRARLLQRVATISSKDVHLVRERVERESLSESSRRSSPPQRRTSNVCTRAAERESSSLLF